MRIEPMDHAYIEEHSLIERYHQGRLPPEEESRFEAHFVGCQQCTEQVELARGFQIGIKTVAATDATTETARLGAVARAGILARLAHRAQRRPLALAAAAAVVAVVATYAWLGITGGKPVAVVAAAPLVNTPVFILSAVRGGNEPTVNINPSDTGGWLTLAVDVDDDPRFDGYRLSVSGAGGDIVWQQDDLLPNALETLMVTFPAPFFTAGDHRLTVEGVFPGGETEAIDSYPFRVVP